MLRGSVVADTLLSMGKTVQVRLPADLWKDASLCAGAFDEAITEYVTRVVREATRRDLPKAARMITKRAEQAGREDGDE